MPRDDDQSLGGDQTFTEKVERDDSPQSLGDEGTYAGTSKWEIPDNRGQLSEKAKQNAVDGQS
ncbi:MAG: hypothetical protein CMJ64_28950 [Planctomycetaceae bacterium]|nr:hypothetical protein [Planctomycetaceae bacterium]